MNRPLLNIGTFIINILLVIIPFSPGKSFADYPLLKKYIIEFNIHAGEKSFSDNIYRGEEGLLQIRPEIGASLGLKIFIDQNYKEAVRLVEQAERSLETAKSNLYTKKKENIPGEYSRLITENFLDYKSRINSAKIKFKAYRSKLSNEIDERLDEDKCLLIMDRLIDESIRKTDSSLRDALGYFYNLCHGVDNHNFPITSENVRFVNFVFSNLLNTSHKSVLGQFCLDREEDFDSSRLVGNWKTVLDENASRLIPIIEDVLKKSGDEVRRIDPLLFISLMRRESNFDPDAISYVGAAGLTQIMPQTAKGIGMENIHRPAYFDEAISILKRERDLRREAKSFLFRIKNLDGIKHAEHARNLIQESLKIAKKRESLFNVYKKELLEKRNDDRLNPDKAIEYGLRYFAKMMKAQNGDISLALASYNAGPHRIEEYNGIPPFEETIGFRNQVLKFYRDYFEKSKAR